MSDALTQIPVVTVTSNPGGGGEVGSPFLP